MNCSKVLLIAVSLFGLSTAQAQYNILNARTPQEIGVKDSLVQQLENDNPLPYGYVNENRDVLWAKTTWEIIDLEQRVNFPLYYPIEDNLGAERRSLFNVLISAIKSGEITEVYDDSYFRTKKTFEEIETSFIAEKLNDIGQEVQIQWAGDPKYSNYFGEDLTKQLKEDGILDETHFQVEEIKGNDVVEYRIRGYWYFDARQGELKYRLLGIAPVAPSALDKVNASLGGAPAEAVPLFWIFFPDARKTLHNALAYNGANSASPFNFDHLLNSRRFSGYIYKEENVYGDRQIEEYMRDNAQLQVLESERIKEQIRNFEQDMWSY